MAISPRLCLQPILDTNGVPSNGALVYVYEPGTTTKISLYTDSGLTAGAANPMVASSGFVPLRFMATQAYKLVVTTSAGASLSHYNGDNIDPGIPIGTGVLAIANGGTGAATAGAALAALGAATASEVSDLASEVSALAGAAASSEKTQIGTGTTAQRPSTPSDGQIRRNTTIPQYEGYDGSGWRKFLLETDIAAQSDMETGTSTTTLVTPGRTQYHPGVAKAWAKVTVSGSTPVLTVGYNVSSVTDNSPGETTLNLTTAFSSSNYAVVCSVLNSSTGGQVEGAEVVSQTTTAIRIRTFTATSSSNADKSNADNLTFFVAAYGDQ